MTDTTDTTGATAPNIKPISNGDFLLWRKFGQQLRKGLPGHLRGQERPPRFRHPTKEAAEAEARRLLEKLPDSTFIILHEVARVKLKPVEPKRPVDSDPAHVFEEHARWVRSTEVADG